MTLLERYREAAAHPEFHQDPEQLRVVERLQLLHDQLLDRNQPNGGWLSRLGFGRERAGPVPGLYIWGGVGRGKTYLVDLFFDHLPFEERQRTHFHRFMHQVHNELKTLRERRDPLTIIAERFAGRTRILCFDEFVVNDITDAMILGGLLKELFSRGVTLVATSNIAPDDLYKEGLQRDRFLPTIELIKCHTHVVHMPGEVDYRLQFLEHAQTYVTPAGAEADQALRYNFDHVAPEAGRDRVLIEVEGRELQARRLADGVVWFDFDVICDGPRSQNDYIELASCFHTLLVSNVPVFTNASNDQARRFINLVDVLYDRHVNLIVSAEAKPTELYQGERLKAEFERTASRLVEMQSRHYLSQTHVA